MRKHHILVIAIFLVIFSAFPALAEQLSGRVVGVHDGDTITVLTVDKRSVRTRLVEIDAPESGQPYLQPLYFIYFYIRRPALCIQINRMPVFLV